MRKTLLILLCAIASFASVQGQDSLRTIQQLDYSIGIETSVNASGGNTPFYHYSLKQGVSSLDPNYGFLRAAVTKPMGNRKLDYGFGIDVVGGGQFGLHNPGQFTPLYLQQLYAEGRLGVWKLTLGAKEMWGELKNPRLSSGGTTWSGNARPVPQGRLEFDYVQIFKLPVYIHCFISYGMFSDNDYLERQFNYQASYVTTDVLFHHKALFLRSPKSNPLVFTAGFETAAQWCGRQRQYRNGQVTYDYADKFTLKKLLIVTIPMPGGKDTNAGDQAYFYGNSLGTIHLKLDYTFKDKSVLSAYYEDIWNDEGGMALQHQVDGLWGVEWDRSRATTHRWLSGVVLEFFKTTTQSGPLHYRPDDYGGVAVGPPAPPKYYATGSDDYYNQFFYNAWAHWGQTAGSPMIVAPSYNRDGYLNIVNNRILGFHLGVDGYITPELKYRLMASYRKGWGAGYIPIAFATETTSAMLEAVYSPVWSKGWSATASFAFDAGTMCGNNTGFQLGVRRSGNLLKW